LTSNDIKRIAWHKTCRDDKRGRRVMLSLKGDLMINDASDERGHRMGERRKHRRHFVDLPLDCCVVQHNRRGPIQSGIAENVGIGGLSIYLNQRFPPGSQLIIELYYKDGYQFSSLRILTKVIWSNQQEDTSRYKHGVKLLRLENGGSQKLQFLLKKSPTLI
jgi:hypothetical protein